MVHVSLRPRPPPFVSTSGRSPRSSTWLSRLQDTSIRRWERWSWGLKAGECMHFERSPVAEADENSAPKTSQQPHRPECDTRDGSQGWDGDLPFATYVFQPYPHPLLFCLVLASVEECLLCSFGSKGWALRRLSLRAESRPTGCFSRKDFCRLEGVLRHCQNAALATSYSAVQRRCHHNVHHYDQEPNGGWAKLSRHHVYHSGVRSSTAYTRNIFDHELRSLRRERLVVHCASAGHISSASCGVSCPHSAVWNPFSAPVFMYSFQTIACMPPRWT